MKYISIVEDRPDISAGIKNQIERRSDLKLEGVFTSAEDAISSIPGTRTEIILMDIGLPKMDGIECMVRLKEKRENLDFLIFTVFDADEQLFTALKYGASGYILKSDGIIGVMNAINEFLAGGAPMSREIARKTITYFQSQAPVRKQLAMLTPKQNEVLSLLAEGLFNYEIADRMGIVPGTVAAHLHTIFRKLHVSNRVEARNKYLAT